MEKGKKIFLAHSSIDKELVRKLYKELKGKGLDPWLDEEDILPGQNWTLEIPNAIRNCDYFIACLSERAIKRQGYMHKEFRMALDIYAEKPPGSIYLIPLKFDDCKVPEIQLPQLCVNFRHIHWLDYWKSNGLSRLLKVFGRENSDISSEKSSHADSLGMEFVYIPPGIFMMGSPENEEGRFNDEFQHEVILTNGFYLQTTEVTQGQWQAVMGNNPSYFKNCGDNCPVESVSWSDVQEFIPKLNRQEDKQYRLPTEAEWEYACRAGSQARFCFGNSDEMLKEYAWFKDNSNMKTHPVAQKKPNNWGLYDMYGNVSEWCQDWYGGYPEESVTDPKGDPKGPYCVLRGGSWRDYGWYLRSALRFRDSPDFRFHFTGFRVARGR